MYKNDYTEVVFGDVIKKIDVTLSGFRQGRTYRFICTIQTHNIYDY